MIHTAKQLFFYCVLRGWVGVDIYYKTQTYNNGELKNTASQIRSTPRLLASSSIAKPNFCRYLATWLMFLVIIPSTCL